MKIARITDAEDGGFVLEYDNTRGAKNTMRLEALSYERAIREAREFLEIHAEDTDTHGDRWDLE